MMKGMLKETPDAKKHLGAKGGVEEEKIEADPWVNLPASVRRLLHLSENVKVNGLDLCQHNVSSRIACNLDHFISMVIPRCAVPN
mmetsp:Transcript_25762/g.43791  ORF Transcript_25762/g.43791 Transcript_25762/m.43791 type:complete len:85 (-) Transcript_25762:8-262(-)